MNTYQFNLPVRSTQLEAIGMVACEWSYLEGIIEASIWNLAHIYDEEIGMSVTTHLSMPQRLDMLLTLFHQRHGDGDAYKELEKHCKNIRKKLSPQRGSIIHTQWVEGDYGSPMQFIVKARGKLEHAKRGRPEAEIHGIAAQIEAQSDQLQKFLKRHGA